MGNLNSVQVQSYVTRRFADDLDKSAVSTFVYRRTEGHPLFMVQVADYLTQREVLATEAAITARAMEAEVPHGLREMIEIQVERLTEAEQQVLEVASVAGAEFMVASVAAGIQTAIETVEEHCERLVRQGQFIEDRGLAVWPDGTVSGRYGFRHALYQDVLYRRLTVGQQVRGHLRIGIREEAGYGERSREIAAELALHFERGQDVLRAVRYRHQAAETALQRHAYQEATSHLNAGLTLLQTLPDTLARTLQELALQVLLGTVIIMNKGWGVPEVETVYARARVLCEQSGDTEQLFPMLWGWFAIHIARVELRAARELGEEMFRLAERLDDRVLRMKAHEALGLTMGLTGDLVTAQQHHEQALALWDPQQPRSVVLLSSLGDSSVVCRGRSAIVLSSMGFVEQGRQQSQAALTRAQSLEHHLSLAEALLNATIMQYILRDAPATREHAERTIAISREWSFPTYLAFATVLRGWALVAQGEVAGGIGQIQEGLILWQGVGMEIFRQSGLAALAEAYQKNGQVAEGLQVVVEALAAVEKSGERHYEAERYRLKGELTLVQGSGFRVGKAKSNRQKLPIPNPYPPTPKPRRVLSKRLRSPVSKRRSYSSCARP